ncbi:MAG: LytR/AlgR family response regulator transcription factor [Pseudomonadota bacterium]
MKTLIVDDEPLARKGLRLRLEQINGIEILRECSNGREALAAIAELQPDLVFLDIQMPGMDGFEVVRRLQQDNMPLVVFVTAYDQFAVQAFEVHAVDYLLKPVDDDRLRDAITRASAHFEQRDAVSDKQRLLELVISITGKTESSVSELLDDSTGLRSYPDRLAIKDAGEVHLVPVKDIDWIDAAGDYMCVHANDETHIMRITMKELEQQLDPGIFQRVHRSTIVNLERVVKVCSHMNGEFFLVLANGSSIKMSRSYKDKVRHFF